MPKKQSFFVYDVKPVKDEKQSTSQAATSEPTSTDGTPVESSSGRRTSIREHATPTIAVASTSMGTEAETSLTTNVVPLRSTDSVTNIGILENAAPLTNIATFPTPVPLRNTDDTTNIDLVTSAGPTTNSGPPISPIPLRNTDSTTNIGLISTGLLTNATPPPTAVPSRNSDGLTNIGLRSNAGPSRNATSSANTELSRSTNPSATSSTSRNIARISSIARNTGPPSFVNAPRGIGLTALATARTDPSLSRYPSHATYGSATQGDNRPGAGSIYAGRSIDTSTVHYLEDSSLTFDRGSREERRSPTPSMYTLEREVRHYIHKRESSAYQFYPGAERLDYNYIEERTDLNSTNLIESTAHLIKGSLGAGVLSMHEAFMYGGLWTSLAVTVCIGILISYAMIILVKSAQTMYVRLRITKLSYPDLAEVAAATSPWLRVRKFSKAFRYLVDICLFLAMCGTCCIYQIMIAHTLKQVFDAFTNGTWLTDMRLYILMSTPTLLLLCVIRSLKFLAPFALLADIFVAMCVMTTLYYSLRTVQVGVMERPGWKDLHGFVRILAICMYCTSGICVALPVENNMRKPRSFRHAIQYAMIIVIILTSMTGFFGYWGWGEECTSPITMHMPVNTFTTILQFLLVMMLSTTFAVQFWVPFRIVWHYIMRKFKKRPAAWERFYRIVMALLITGMSMVVPNLIPFMIFLGQFLLGFIGIVFPAFIEILVFWEEDYINGHKLRIIKNGTLIVLGLFISSTAYYSIKE